MRRRPAGRSRRRRGPDPRLQDHRQRGRGNLDELLLEREDEDGRRRERDDRRVRPREDHLDRPQEEGVLRDHARRDGGGHEGGGGEDGRGQRPDEGADGQHAAGRAREDGEDDGRGRGRGDGHQGRHPPGGRLRLPGLRGGNG